MPKGRKRGGTGKGKSIVNNSGSSGSGPTVGPGIGDLPDFDQMSLEKFETWSPTALKSFLTLRKKSLEGTFKELASRAFVAWEERLEVDLSQEQLLRANLNEYKEKLCVADTILPDPFTLEEGWLSEAARVNWPKLYFCNIADYLSMLTSKELYHRLCNEYKQGKAYRYFTSGWVKVSFHPISTTSKVCFLSTKVSPSMRTSMPPYQVWAAVVKDTTKAPGGTILSAYCTCTAGLHGTCNHIAGLLFRVEYAVRAGLTTPTSTSQLCVWDKPSAEFQPSKPLVMAEQKWEKEQYFNQDRDDYQLSVEQRGVFSPMSATQEQYAARNTTSDDLARLLKDELPNCCFVQMYYGTPFPVTKSVVGPTPPIEIAKSIAMNGEDASVDVLKSSLQLTDEQMKNLSLSTLDQSNSENWHQQRAGRITASNFSRVNTRVETLKKKDADPTALISDLMGYNTCPQTAVMKHGAAQEPHAKRKYTRLCRKSHRQFFTEDSGLHVCKDYPFIGASPDLFVTCKCHGKGLCEIKCPYKIRGECPTHNNWDQLILIDGKTKLSEKSRYYLQVQGQMGVTGTTCCDFFVYTSHGYHLERIMFRAELWQKLLDNLVFFWTKYLAPEMLSGDLFAAPDELAATGIKLDHSYCKDDESHNVQVTRPGPSVNCRSRVLTKPCLPLVFLCGICGADISSCPDKFEEQSVECSECKVWFHFVCVNVLEENVPSQDEKWLCKICKTL